MSSVRSSSGGHVTDMESSCHIRARSMWKTLRIAESRGQPWRIRKLRLNADLSAVGSGRNRSGRNRTRTCDLSRVKPLLIAANEMSVKDERRSKSCGAYDTRRQLKTL